MARELALLVNLKPAAAITSTADLKQVEDRLASSGYTLRNPRNLEAMASQRTDHMSCVNALAEHLGRPTTVLVRQS